MNLTKKRIIIPENSILNFREYQHGQIEQFLQLGIQYLQTHGFNYNPTQASFEIIDNNTYENVGYYATKVIKIKMDPTAKEVFLNLAVPKLLYGSFFKLNGVNYVPIFFINDLPIVKKPKSSKLYSLFCPITLFFKESRVIIYGNNIPISRFLSLFYTMSEIKQLSGQFDFSIVNEPLQITLNYFAKMFNCQSNIEDIITKVNLLFFDNWTLNLYKQCYNLEEINLKYILDLLFLKLETVNEDPLTFIDLKGKRLVYAETLLIPYFRAISEATKALLKGQQPFKLNLVISSITDHFFKALNKLNLYDITGGFSSILELKATYQNPASKSELPTSVSLIHESYKEKVCIVAVSNTKTGRVVSLVPSQTIDLNYGLFNFNED